MTSPILICYISKRECGQRLEDTVILPHNIPLGWCVIHSQLSSTKHRIMYCWTARSRSCIMWPLPV